MSYYFDPSEAADVLLLNSAVRTDSELTNIANPTEDDVRQLYTVWDEDSEAYVVKLKGYDATPADANATFRKAYKQTIADVISWRLLNYPSESNQKGIKRVKRGKREEEYFNGYDPRNIPDGLFWRLAMFDIKEPAWGI